MEVAELRRLRSRSFDAASPIMPSRSVLSPVSPSGGAGSDADSTEIESPTPGNLRSRSTSTDSPPPARLWKSIGIVRNLFRSRVRTPSAPAEDTFFLWDELPEAVRYAVTSFLSVRDVLSIAAVSREAYMFARSGTAAPAPAAAASFTRLCLSHLVQTRCGARCS